MFVVAIHGTHPTDGSRAPALAAVLGVTAYDARPRVVSPGPCVVDVTGDEAAARQLEARLRDAGFPAFVRDAAGLDRPERTLAVRTFALEDAGWTLASREGRRATVPWADVVAVVVGTRVVEETVEETVTTKKGSIGRAIATGGLVRSKKIRKTVERTEQEREGFLHAYTRAGGVIVVLETAVDYAGLGEARQPTRQASYGQLTKTLRQRTPHAPFDDRLLTLAGQRQLLGPRIDAEEHVELASALLASWLLLK